MSSAMYVTRYKKNTGACQCPNFEQNTVSSESGAGPPSALRGRRATVRLDVERASHKPAESSHQSMSAAATANFITSRIT